MNAKWRARSPKRAKPKDFDHTMRRTRKSPGREVCRYVYQPARVVSILFAMRHKYETRGIVLSRAPCGRSKRICHASYADWVSCALAHRACVGLARNSPPRSRPLPKATWCSCEGRRDWRIAGAVLKENWFLRMRTRYRTRARPRICGLLLRLVAGETRDPALFPIIHGFFEALSKLPEETHEAARNFSRRFACSRRSGSTQGRFPAAEFTPSVRAEIAKSARII